MKSLQQLYERRKVNEKQLDRQFNQGNCVKCNEDCKKRMNLKQVEKHTTQRFRCLINHTCVFSMVCVGACKYAHISFPSRPEKRTINISRLLSRSSSLISTPSSSENVFIMILLVFSLLLSLTPCRTGQFRHDLDKIVYFRRKAFLFLC